MNRALRNICAAAAVAVMLVTSGCVVVPARTRARAVWVPGHWVAGANGSAWVHGHWRV